MSLDADILVDRRRLKRRLSLWRFIAIASLLAVLIAAGIGLSGDGWRYGFAHHVARVTVSGLITDNRKQQKLFDEIVKSDKVKAVILHINSPGGTTTGSEALFAAIRRVSADKPVVAVLGTVAASGGYVAALASDHIVARGNTLTGSIGVIFRWAEVSELMQKLGVKVEDIKSGTLKAEPSPFKQIPEEAREVARRMVLDSYEWFVGLVAERRPFDRVRARQLSDGRVYTGRQALDVKLIDAIGGERTALTWLQETKGIDGGLEVVDWTVSSIESLSWSASATVWLLRALGLGGLAEAMLLTQKTLGTERLSLDGLISVWHPAS
ncbi:MAG: signal peptide peptidase SppA [Hyphomicrobiales bacterium]